MSLDDWMKPDGSNKKGKKEQETKATPVKPEKDKVTKKEGKKKRQEMNDVQEDIEDHFRNKGELEESKVIDASDEEQPGRRTREGTTPEESSLKLVGLTTFVLSCAKCKVKRTIKAVTLRAGHKICKKCGGEMKVKQT